MKTKLWFLLSFCIAIFPLLAYAQDTERIISFNSDIEIFTDASMRVIETIRVRSTGDKIKRGIYRDFPIAYRDSYGHRYLVEFELLSVTKNGVPEPYHTERSGNGIRIYIGKEDVFVPPGEHEYALAYKTARQLGFFKDHDELYWNTTGNGWIFDIDEATAKVTLPRKVPPERINAVLYRGLGGSTVQQGEWHITEQGVIEFTTNWLHSYEGMTIVVSWPKGIVETPTALENYKGMITSNADYIIGIIGLIVVLLYYLFTWNKIGRDPERGTIIAEYDPPRGFSPAFLRFIRHMGYDNRAFAASIINLGVKERIKITEEKGFLKRTSYTLTATGKPSVQFPAEEQLLEDNFFKKSDTFLLKTDNASELSKILKNFGAQLKTQAGNMYFAKNFMALAIGIALSATVMLATMAVSEYIRFTIDSLLQILFLAFLIVAFLILNSIFGWLIRAYTKEGRKLADEIEGFKLFLSVTEKERLTFHNPPEKTPELFEKFLPYALALDVEHQWAQQFADVFAKLETQGTVYAPAWFVGSLPHFSPESFTSAISDSFTGVVASSSTSPGSSSGFGGSSGGGGGGGGGGW